MNVQAAQPRADMRVRLERLVAQRANPHDINGGPECHPARRQPVLVGNARKVCFDFVE